MDDLEGTGELADMMAANENARIYVDPREIPSRFSLLKQMSLSAAHYLAACQQPQDDTLASKLGGLAPVGTKRSDALRFGSACHLLLLGEERAVAKFTGARRAGRAWEEFQHEVFERGCKEILNEKEHALATEIVAAIRRNPTAMRLLFDGTIVEQRIDWTWLGKAMRSTPDARGANHLVDLKTAVSSKPDVFIRHGLRYFMHAQAALYVTATLETTGHEIGDCYLVAVEKSRPYPVTILRLTERALNVGHRLCRLWMEALLECERSNQWPEYAESPVAFDLPTLDEPMELEIDGRMVAV